MKTGIFWNFFYVSSTGEAVFQDHLGECNTANVSVKQYKGLLLQAVVQFLSALEQQKRSENQSPDCIALQILRPSIHLIILTS